MKEDRRIALSITSKSASHETISFIIACRYDIGFHLGNFLRTGTGPQSMVVIIYFDVVNVPRPSERTQAVFPGLHTFATGDYE